MKKRTCRVCGLRWMQSRLVLCRSCERAHGDRRTTQDRDRERLARRHPPPVPAHNVAPRRVVEIQGEAFEVVWGGVGPLPRDE